MAESLGALTNVSGAVREHAASTAVASDQINASATDAANQQAMALYNKYLQEVDAADPTSTIGGPNHPSFKPVFVTGPPTTVVVMPDISSQKPACYSESWWTRHLVPTPQRDSDLSFLVAKKNLSAGLAAKEIKYPPAVKNYPIKFDRYMDYKEFLS